MSGSSQPHPYLPEPDTNNGAMEAINPSQPRSSKKRDFPDGVSLAKVSPKGNLPTCRGCMQQLERNTHMIVTQ
ncbi:hypothetical protein BGZ82_003495, partial [Podila clonocystis]